MDSLVGYGSDDDNETERYGGHHSAVAGHQGRRREDDTNYDNVNMDMSEDSLAESEPELPQAEPAPSSRHSSRAHDERRGSDDSRDRDRDRSRPRDERRDRRRDSPVRSRDKERVDRRSPRRDDRYRSDKADRGSGGSGGRRGLLGDRPDARPPALMDLRPFGGEPPPADARDAVSPRFVDRERRDRDRERDRDRHGRRSEEKRLSRGEGRGSRERRGRSRSRSRGAAFPPPPAVSTDRRGSPPSGDYRPSSYKLNKKLEVMEKMGLQIKTPDGSMATASQLRAAAGDAPPTSLPSYYNPSAVNTAKILDQVQKRKLLWSHKAKTAEAAPAPAGQWSGARFAQDSDGKQASKFMRLMGIKDPDAVKAEKPPPAADPIKKQEELFQAMQAQYEVARATTHTMRGVGLGFQRTPY